MKAIDLGRSFGYLTENEILALADAARDLSIPKNHQHQPIIINVGAGAGTSGLTLTEANPKAIVITIDISSGGPLGGHEGERNAFAGTGLRLPYQLLGDSKELAKVWRQMVDMVFIDGDHSEEGIRGDLVWCNALRSDGVLAIHDYGSPRWPAVKAVTDEFIEKLKEKRKGFLLTQADTLLVIKFE